MTVIALEKIENQRAKEVVHKKDFIFTSESVSEGHPDKICDRISDAILDTYLAQDPESRVAVETMVTTNKIIIAGEVRGPESITHNTIEEVARRVVKDIGYEQGGFHWENADVEVYVHQQSPDIAVGVDASGSKEEGAGDQGIMFGYACNETDQYMPAPIHYSHMVLRDLFRAIHSGAIPKIGPDAKSQVTLEYKNGKPVRAASVVLSIQHPESMGQQDIVDTVTPYIQNVLPEGWITPETELFINPTGKFVIGGPDGDCGLTGRKIIVDTYGGAAPHGGGCFSGKDSTKVDRSAAYAARYLAKNAVAAGLAERCTIQLSYAIGIAKPLSFYVNTHGTASLPEERIAQILQDVMDLSPNGIRKHLQLNRPIFEWTANYGHFGRKPREDGSFSWEKLDLVEKLKSELE